MKFDRIFVKVMVICLPLCLITVACKKRKAFKQENGQGAEDIRSAQAPHDDAVRDVNVAIMEQFLLRGRSSSELDNYAARTELCGVDIDTSDVFSGITKLHYNGKSCDGTTKTGDILVTVMEYPLKKWKNKGCKVKIEFVAYKVMRSDGKSVQINGTEYMTNVSGNTWYDMRYLNSGSLVQTHTADNLKVSFDNNTAIFNFNRKLTFSYSATTKVTTCTIEGLGTVNGISNVENWGQNRDGVNFITEMTTPVVWKSSCGSDSPVAGETIVSLDGKSYKMKCQFGVDSEGESVSVDGTCAYGWKASWSYKNKTSTRIIAYN